MLWAFFFNLQGDKPGKALDILPGPGILTMKAHQESRLLGDFLIFSLCCFQPSPARYRKLPSWQYKSFPLPSPEPASKRSSHLKLNETKDGPEPNCSQETAHPMPENSAMSQKSPGPEGGYPGYSMQASILKDGHPAANLSECLHALGPCRHMMLLTACPGSLEFLFIFRGPH